MTISMMLQFTYFTHGQYTRVCIYSKTHNNKPIIHERGSLFFTMIHSQTLVLFSSRLPCYL